MLAYLRGEGGLSRVATLRAMARAGDEQTLVDLKAVDGAYPVRGDLVLDPPLPPRSAIGTAQGRHTGVAEAALFERLGVAVGGTVRVGDVDVTLTARIVAEPDRLATGFGFGTRLILSDAALEASGLVQPGSLIRWTYRLALDDPGRADAIAATVARRFPESGLEARTRANLAPAFARNLERFAQFLSFVGLAALIVGGVGVANAVSGHVAGKRTTIATLKALGASGGTVMAIELVQIAAIAALGIAVGIAGGIALAAAGVAAAGTLLPFPVPIAAHGSVVALAAAYGVLVAGAFALWPLARARLVPVRALYRDDGGHRRRSAADVAAVVVMAALLIGLALVTAEDARLAAGVLAGSGAALILLAGIGRGIVALARRLPHPRAAVPRLALAAVHRPGALTPTIVLSLGLGLTLLVALAMVDGNLRRQLTGPIPERAPSFFFLDVPSGEVERLQALIEARVPGGRFESVPQLRGRITGLRGVAADQAEVRADARFVLDGDRGITFAAEPPANSRLVSGDWWAADHAGPPLVSFDHRLAQGLGLGIGDEIAVNVMGRTVRARLANTRTVQWESFGINFVMVFSPNAFRGAPFSALATWTAPPGTDDAAERAILREVSRALPGVATVRVKEALDQANGLVGNVALGVRAVAGVAIVAAVLVLAGALAASARARLRDAVILKVLGATRAA